MSTPEYLPLGIEITNHTTAINASINYEVRKTRKCTGDEEIYSFNSYIEIEGFRIYPEGHNDITYSITIYGEERADWPFSLKLNDCQKIDDELIPIYRKIRGKEVPVYDLPKGIGYIERQRGIQHWRGAIWVPQRTITDMLALLPHVQPLYLDILTIMEKKHQNITSLSLQTNNPAES
ncbi:MAG: hypothetical protein COA45_12390 [Zetaproteobacteria bacterium]|nr:MAG: hypothetical protein COA45_12390 [Zetaproteobacteria bacterium]